LIGRIAPRRRPLFALLIRRNATQFAVWSDFSRSLKNRAHHLHSHFLVQVSGPEETQGVVNPAAITLLRA
jgi:hypothetical protein